MQTKKTNPDMSTKDFEQLGRDLWLLYEMNYKNRRRMYFFTFGKGIAQGFGIFLGGTILVAVLLYSLSFFERVPLLSPIVEKLNNVLTDPTSVQQQKP
jgi:hypothetical protein